MNLPLAHPGELVRSLGAEHGAPQPGKLGHGAAVSRSDVWRNMELSRVGDVDAAAALFSFALPRGGGGGLAPAHARVGI
ncbi:MAG: hypothetical protein ACOYM3_09280, partial [Terrimicrobiaceae bacterium]